MTKRMTALLFLFLGFGISARAEIIPAIADRMTDWTGAGIPGGIVNRTVGSNPSCPSLGVAGQTPTYVQGAVTAATVNSAIIACGNAGGGVVYLNPGTYQLSNVVAIEKNNVSLRGSGPGSTIVKFTGSSQHFIRIGVGLTSGDSGTVFNSIYSTTGLSITSGATKGLKTITLSNTGGIAAGDILVIDQQNDSSVMTCGYCSRDNSNRERGQVTEVDSVSGNTVTLKDPLHLNYTTTPQAVLIKANAMVRYSGLEDMTVTQPQNEADGGVWYVASSPGALIYMSGTEYCWVKNVEIKYISTMGVILRAGLHNEVRENYLHDVSLIDGVEYYGNSHGYGIMLFLYQSGSLIENNIGERIGQTLDMSGVISGNVLAYNYLHSTRYGSVSDSGGPRYENLGFDENSHGAYTMMNLWEGNSVHRLDLDFTHGNAGFHTLFRDYLRGYQEPALNVNNVVNTLHVNAVQFDPHNDYMNVIGSVLGTPGKSQSYSASSPDAIAIFDLGEGDWYDGVDDPNVKSTLVRGGNYDYVTNSTVWNTNAPSGETASTYLASQTLPASLFRSERPSWFATPWGTPPWPPIGGSDVNQGNADSAGHANKIPAQLCYENTARNADSTLNFNANNCYHSGGNPGPTPTPTPTPTLSPSPTPTPTWSPSPTPPSTPTTAPTTSPTPTPTATSSPISPPMPIEGGFVPFKNVFNPEKESVTIKFYFPADFMGELTLAVYDRLGTKVKELNPEATTATWEGRNSDNQIVASGTYVLILKKGDKTFKKKVVVIK